MQKVLAIVAHPDDIEFVMAGTLLLLAQRGWEVHYFNIANGCCGSMSLSREEIASQRLSEAREAASKIPAHFHDPICDDLAIFYDEKTLAKVSSAVRRANPTIVLTHSPCDYMEDHQNACRLAVTAAFSKNMPNFPSVPPFPAVTGDVAVYHAQPHGNVTVMGEPILPDFAIDISQVIDKKAELLRCHRSQQGWLDSTQKMSSYIQTMYDLGSGVSKLIGASGFSEGWRQRNSLGFGAADWNPLRDSLKEFVRS